MVRDTARTLLARFGGFATISLGLVVLCCVFLAMAAPREGLGLRTRALQRELSAATPLQRSVTGSIDYSAYASGFNGPPGAAALAATRAQLAAALAKDRLPLAKSGGWTGLATGFVKVTGVSPSLSAGGLLPPQLELLYRDNLTSNASLVAGRLPASARSSGAGIMLQAAVTEATAARFGLRPGSLIGAGPGTGILVTGIIKPGGAGPFWAADPVAAVPALNELSDNMPAYWTAAAFVAPAEVGPLPQAFSPADMKVSWDFPLALGSATASQAAALDAALVKAQTQPIVPGANPAAAIDGPAPVTISSGIITRLGGFVSQDRATGQVLDLMSVSLAVVAAVVIVLGAYLATQRRRRDFAVLRARGASAGWLALRVSRTCAAVTLPAAVAGGAIAVLLTPGDNDPLGWLLSVLTLAVALTSVPLIIMVQRRGAESPSRRLAAEAALAAAAVGGLLALRQNGQPGGGLYPSTAPVLVAVPAAIVIMRLYPPVLRALRRAAALRPRATGFVGFARAANAAPVTVLPVFALVLALSVVAFGVTVRSAVADGQVAASWQRTGADAIIDASASARPLDPAVQRAIAAVPGVRRTAGIVVEAGGPALTVAAVDPARYAALVAATPGPAFPAASLARPARGPVPALVSPAAARLTGRGLLGGITVRAAGPISRLPGVTGGALVVLPDWALRGDPTIMLAVGPRLDAARLRAVVRRDLPGGTVIFRSAVLAALTAAPLPHGAYLAIVAGTIAAVVLSALIIVAAVALGGPARDATVARLRILGLARRQATWLVAAEVLPQIVAGAIGGIACAAAMAPLLGPAIDLSVFTGEQAALRPQPGLLAAAAGGLLLLGMLLLAGQAQASSEREPEGEYDT